MNRSVLILSALFAIGSLPTSASAQFAKPKDKQQIKLGKEAAAQVRKEEKILPETDPRVVTMRRVAERLLATRKTKEPWEFTFEVIDKDEINAFALPGGAVFFFSGLINKMKSEDELAGVLGHEMTHVRKEHWARSYRDQQNRGLWLTLGMVATGVGDNLATAVGLANSLVTQKYSRGYENESDDNGFTMLVDAGYNPIGLADVFRMFDKEKAGGGSPEFLASHPSDKNRIKRLEDKIKKLNRTFPELIPMSFPEQVKKDAEAKEAAKKKKKKGDD